MLRIGIIGEGNSKGLTQQTQLAINKINNLQTEQVRIDLVMFNDITNQSNHVDEVFVYSNFTGSDNVALCVKMIEHYIINHRPDFLVYALEDNSELVLPIISELFSMASFLDCVDIEVKKEKLYITKPIYAGNVTSHYQIIDSSIISLRSQSIDKEVTPQSNRSFTINYIQEKQEINNCYKKTEEKLDSDSLDNAKYVIVCGYGVGSKEEIAKIELYGRKHGFIICGTKKIIDLGWLPINRMIGQTGHIISPDICITIGVSGAAPLLNGIIKSKKIISINKDANARIFNYSDYGIITDFKSVVIQELIEQ